MQTQLVMKYFRFHFQALNFLRSRRQEIVQFAQKSALVPVLAQRLQLSQYQLLDQKSVLVPVLAQMVEDKLLVVEDKLLVRVLAQAMVEAKLLVRVLAQAQV
jgi:hypothetical protein